MIRVPHHIRTGFATFVVALQVAACGRDSDPAGKAPAVAMSESVRRVEAAVARFRGPAKSIPSPFDPQLDAAMNAITLRNTQRAREVCNDVLAKDPNNSRALYYRGFANHREKLFAAARPDFERVLDAGPNFSAANGVFVYYAWCCYYLGDLDTSVAAFTATETLGIDPPDAQYGLGLIGLERGDLDDAEKHLRESKRLAEAVLAKKGLRATNSDRTDFAKTEVRLGSLLLQRSELDPANADAYLKEARTFLTDATKYVAWNEDCWFNLSRVYHRLGEFELEKDALERIRKGREKIGASPLQDSDEKPN